MIVIVQIFSSVSPTILYPISGERTLEWMDIGRRATDLQAKFDFVTDSRRRISVTLT